MENSRFGDLMSESYQGEKNDDDKLAALALDISIDVNRENINKIIKPEKKSEENDETSYRKYAVLEIKDYSELRVAILSQNHEIARILDDTFYAKGSNDDDKRDIFDLAMKSSEGLSDESIKTCKKMSERVNKIKNEIVSKENNIKITEISEITKEIAEFNLSFLGSIISCSDDYRKKIIEFIIILNLSKEFKNMILTENDIKDIQGEASKICGGLKIIKYYVCNQYDIESWEKGGSNSTPPHYVLDLMAEKFKLKLEKMEFKEELKSMNIRPDSYIGYIEKMYLIFKIPLLSVLFKYFENQKSIADAVGGLSVQLISPQTISKWNTMDRLPCTEYLMPLYNFLKVNKKIASMEDFFKSLKLWESIEETPDYISICCSGLDLNNDIDKIKANLDDLKKMAANVKVNSDPKNFEERSRSAADASLPEVNLSENQNKGVLRWFKLEITAHMNDNSQACRVGNLYEVKRKFYEIFSKIFNNSSVIRDIEYEKTDDTVSFLSVFMSENKDITKISYGKAPESNNAKLEVEGKIDSDLLNSLKKDLCRALNGLQNEKLN